MGCLWSRYICRNNDGNIKHGDIGIMEKSLRVITIILIVLILTVIVYHLNPKGERYIMNETDSEYVLAWLHKRNAEPCTLTPVSKDVWHCKKSNGEKYIIKR
jgi:hypothetical protein